MAKKADGKPGQVQLDVAWTGGAELEPVFVDNLHLARVNNQYYLTFGQIRLPVSSGTAPKTGELRSMVRLVVTRESLERIVALLNRNLEK